MRSKWYELKEKALLLRTQGVSIRTVERRLGIPRSTLSGWFRNVSLSDTHKNELTRRWENALIKARRKAVLWHNAQKKQRLQEAKDAALKTLLNINVADTDILELTLALLYLGEGSKKTIGTAIGSSDPLILKFFLAILKKVYSLNPAKIRCELHLRADQNPETTKLFWAKELQLPLTSFRYITLDRRTIGSKTYPGYHGVCDIRCGTAEIQRKLLCLSDLFCNKVVDNYWGS